MGEPLLDTSASHEVNRLEPKPVMYFNDEPSEAIDEKHSAPDILDTLLSIRNATIDQFSKTMSVKERRVIENITSAIVDRLVETSRSHAKMDCLREEMTTIQHTVEQLFVQDKLSSKSKNKC